jgi:hypothetical protein
LRLKYYKNKYFSTPDVDAESSSIKAADVASRLILIQTHLISGQIIGRETTLGSLFVVKEIYILDVSSALLNHEVFHMLLS